MVEVLDIEAMSAETTHTTRDLAIAADYLEAMQERVDASQELLQSARRAVRACAHPHDTSFEVPAAIAACSSLMRSLAGTTGMMAEVVHRLSDVGVHGLARHMTEYMDTVEIDPKSVN